MAYMTQNLAVTQPLMDRFSALRAEFSHRRAQRAEADRVFRELSLMSDYELADLGISRHSIRDIAADAARRI
ncbi:DUF1127 domain-containing protein [Celeribacter baekdonensis]|jgi:uncharacterized protein YjiS (DUF1127 family)|uniref:YjiS-like domain-containing protein n=1 Tax=Celeribacter baekdonensis TaxID=875171 RepID=A0A2R4M208_9RHOB|nr:DUF1127 domain-containing protein [Celeribacter baekdonensis]AVW91147.1 hypothetical protein DA792_08640 [Celeribacter baekdonensis]|tara:strand:+ start:1852 stop:2067 length:216 start_codon:yes stop_codon:yes gene_type:complete